MQQYRILSTTLVAEVGKRGQRWFEFVTPDMMSFCDHQILIETCWS